MCATFSLFSLCILIVCVVETIWSLFVCPVNVLEVLLKFSSVCPRDLSPGREVSGRTDRECHHWGEGDEVCDGEIRRGPQEAPYRPGEDKTTERGIVGR